MSTKMLDKGAQNDDAPEVVYVDEGGREGAFITDEAGVRFWLTADQLDEYDEMDHSITDDHEFSRWFRDWRHKNNIFAVVERGRRQWRDIWKKPEPPKYLSEWSLDTVYRAAANTDETIYLAEMLGAVSSIVRVLEPPGIRYRVVFTSDRPEAPNSYTSFEERLVSVSPQAVLDKKLERGTAIDVTSGFGLHEGSHGRWGEDIYGPLLADKSTLPRPWSIGMLLLNVVEDVRIERLTGEEFPGFAPYFEVANGYLWKGQKSLAPKEWGPDLKAKINSVILSVKWGKEYEPTARAEPTLSAEFDWWRAWSDRYQANVDARTTVQEGIDHLRLDKNTSEELDKLTKREDELEKAIQDFEQAVKEALKEWKNNGGKVVEVCPTPGRSEGEPGDPSGGKPGKDILVSSLAEEIERLVDEEMMVDKPNVEIKSNGRSAVPRVVILKPKRGYDKLPTMKGSLVTRMRNAFKFRPQENDQVERMQRSGRIDGPQLHRWAQGDYRVFERKIRKQKPDSSVTLLIDQSGSMGDTKLRNAIKVAQVIHACLKDMPGVKVRVRSHTADSQKDGGSKSAVIYRIWEQGEPMDQLTAVFRLPHMNNADGYAIDWCARELLKETRPNEQRLLIVLSDGQPSFSGYSYGEGRKHVHDVVKWAEAKGVIVVQIAIDEAMRPDAQREMFTNWIPFEGMDKLPTQVTNLLKRLL